MRIFRPSRLIPALRRKGSKHAALRPLGRPTTHATLGGSGADVRVRVNNGVSEGRVYLKCKVFNFGTISPDRKDAASPDPSYIVESIKSMRTPEPTLSPIPILMSHMNTSHQLFA